MKGKIGQSLGIAVLAAGMVFLPDAAARTREQVEKASVLRVQLQMPGPTVRQKIL